MQIFVSLVIHISWLPELPADYRPHPKDGEGSVFAGMWMSTEGVPPYLSHNTSIHSSHVLSEGTTVAGSMFLPGGYPNPRSGVCRPRQDGVPPLQPGLDGLPPWWQYRVLSSKDRKEYPLAGQDGVPPRKDNRTAEWVLTMWRAVCLLRSRRTFLFKC